MSYKKYYDRYKKAIDSFIEQVEMIQSETDTYVKLRCEDTEITNYGDFVKKYCHHIWVDDIILQ